MPDQDFTKIQKQEELKRIKEEMYLDPLPENRIQQQEDKVKQEEIARADAISEVKQNVAAHRPAESDTTGEQTTVSSNPIKSGLPNEEEHKTAVTAEQSKHVVDCAQDNKNWRCSAQEAVASEHRQPEYVQQKFHDVNLQQNIEDHARNQEQNTKNNASNQGPIHAQEQPYVNRQRQDYYHREVNQPSQQNRQQYEYYQPGMGNTQQQKPKKAGNVWKTGVALALVFGLIAGSMTYAVNKVANTISPITTQSAKEVQQTKTIEGGTPPVSTVQQTADTTKTVAQVVQETLPSLVTIATVSVQELQSFFGIQQFEEEGAGTGVIVGENDTELLIATNNHVVRDATEISVGFIDEEVASATVKGVDKRSDLAIIAVSKEEVPEETIENIRIATIGDSDEVVLGDQVVAIGNALGVGQSVTSGYVSALNRELELSDGYTSFVSSDLIQTDAAINSGNSGGALLNMKGELIGINEAKSAYTMGGVAVDNVGYAIPMSKAKPILDDLISQADREVYDENKQGYLGVSLVYVSQEMSEMYSMPEGAAISVIVEDSPAEEYGLKKGDIIKSVNGRTIADVESMLEEMTHFKSGEEVEIVVYRADDGEYKDVTVNVKLGNKDVISTLEQKR